MRAQAYPARPVRVIVGLAAGGGTDIVARLIGQWLGDRLGQPFVIENRPGAGGNIATETVVHASPDGYTLLAISPAAAINATLYDKLSYDFLRDIAPISGLLRVANVMLVTPALAAATVPEFIAYAKANPNRVNFGSAGVGSSNHLCGELFNLMTGTKMVHVPYRGAAPALTDVIAGQVQVLFGSVTSSIAYLRADKVRALAVTSAERVDVLPEVPALSEFVPGYEASNWWGLGAPRATPPDIIALLNREIAAGFADPKIRARLAELGGPPLAGSAAAFGRLIAERDREVGQGDPLRRNQGRRAAGKDAVRLSRRGLIGLAATLPVLAPRARAQAYPNRPVTLVVFVPAGGAPDITARLVGQALSQRLGQAIVIDNRPGAGGNLALQAVARAPADGYTLLLIATPHAVNVTLYEKHPVTVANDIALVSGIYTGAFAMVVNPSLPVKSVAEFISAAKASPGKFNLTSSGAGNLSHLSGELFRMMTGVDMVHVPYKGTVPALAGLVAGDVHLMFDSMTSVLPHIQSGRLRALAVTSARRSPALPDVPTVGESVPGYVVTGWLGIGVPKGTPAEIVDKLNREINAVLAEPVIHARFAELGSEPLPGTPADFGRHFAAEVEKWAKVIRFAGIKPE
jgi:tripartite-type tricarboxylate transporter receptor subunit TctC